jgi:hypothetical protein
MRSYAPVPPPQRAWPLGAVPQTEFDAVAVLPPTGYQPDRLIRSLAPAFGRPSLNIEGFHIFTFNELERTEAWRQGLMARLAALTPRMAEQSLTTSDQLLGDLRLDHQRILRSFGQNGECFGAR